MKILDQDVWDIRDQNDKQILVDFMIRDSEGMENQQLLETMIELIESYEETRMYVVDWYEDWGWSVLIARGENQFIDCCKKIPFKDQELRLKL